MVVIYNTGYSVGQLMALVYKFTTQRYTHHMTANPNPNPT